jgi:hypothetical protein
MRVSSKKIVAKMHEDRQLDEAKLSWIIFDLAKWGGTAEVEGVRSKGIAKTATRVVTQELGEQIRDQLLGLGLRFAVICVDLAHQDSRVEELRSAIKTALANAIESKAGAGCRVYQSTCCLANDKEIAKKVIVRVYRVPLLLPDVRFHFGVTEEEEVPKPVPEEVTVIHLNEVAKARAEVDKLQAAVVTRVQELLDRLAGRRGAGPAENKEIADEVYDAARSSGVQLLCKGQPANIRWDRGVFEARTTDATRKTLVQSAEFPHLIARAKIAAQKSHAK